MEFKEELIKKGYSQEEAEKFDSFRCVVVQGIDENIQAKIEELSKRGITDKTEIFDAIKGLQDKIEDNSRSIPVEDEKLKGFKDSLRAVHKNITENKSPSRGEFKESSIRAAAVMTLADIVSDAPDFVSTTVDKTIHAAKEQRLGVVNRLNRGASRTAVTRYTSLAGSEGNAAVTAEGALKPLFSTSYTKAEATFKKIPIRLKMSEEFEDFTEMYNDLILRARRNINLVLEKEVVNGAGGADHLVGITVIAPAFNVPALAGTVTNSNSSDAIYAQTVQIGMLGYNANVCFINYLDYAKLQLIKDTTGRPLTNEVMAKISNLTFILVGSDIITAGNSLVMDDAYWQLYVNEIKVKEGYGVEKVDTEYYSDLDLNLRTIIFELYVKSFCPAVELGSVCYDSIETILEAISVVEDAPVAP